MAKFKKKQANTEQNIPTSAMPDVAFMLIIFFMVTTVMREVELQVQIEYAEAENIEKIERKRLVRYVYLGPERLPGGRLGDTNVQIDESIIDDLNALRQKEHEKVLEQPKIIVPLRV